MRGRGILVWLLFAGSIAFCVVAGLLVLHANDRSTRHVTVAGRSIALTSAQRRGHAVFAAKCAVCHRLAASNSFANVGPSLDYVQPTYSQVRAIVHGGINGYYGAMPAGLAQGPDLDAVARYVSGVADRRAVFGR